MSPNPTDPNRALAAATAERRPARFSRRKLLLGGGSVLALAAAGTGAVLFAPWPNLRGRKWLTPAEGASALALAAVLFDEPGLPAAHQVDLLTHLDGALDGMHPTTRMGVRTGLRALEYATMPGYLSRFSELPLETRKAAVRQFERRPYLMSQLMLSLRFQIAACWFESDAGKLASEWRLGCTPSGAEG